ncbi:hypothetical protein D3C80_588420 [compost metagenome]
MQHVSLGVGPDQPGDQGVHCRVLQHHVVVGARVGGRLGTEVIEQFASWRSGDGVAGDDHVVVAAHQAVDVLGRVDAADIEVDADLFQRAFIGQQQTVHAVLADQEREAQRLAVGIDQLVAIGFPAGLFEQVQGLQLLVANHAAAIGLRRLEHFGEDFVGNLPAQRFENRQLTRIRQLPGREIGIGKKALLADVHVAHHLPVAPLEVPQHHQRLAHVTVLEHGLLQIEHKTLGRLRRLCGEVGFLQATIAQGRAFVADGVSGGGKFPVVVKGAAAQHLARHVGIAEVLDAEMIEVVQATADRQILAPPIGVALEGDAAPRIDLADCIGTAAQRRFIAAATGEIAALPPVFGKHRQGCDIQGQGAIFVVLEIKADGQWRFHFDAFDVGELGSVAQAALGHQQVEGVAHVLGGNRFAIGKTRLGVEVKAQGQAVL